MFPGKLKSRWYGPFSVCRDMKNGAIKLYDEDGNEFIVNKQRVEPYEKSVLDTNRDDDITLDDEGEVTKFLIKNKEEIFTDAGDGVRIYPDGVASPAMLYLMRRSLEILRKFHWTTLGGRFNQLSHVSSPLLSKQGSTSRKVHLLEDKQIPSVGVFDEVFSTWMAFGGNTRDLGSFREETDEITDLHQILEEILLTERGDGVASIKRHRRDLFNDDVWNLETAPRRGRLKEDLESST
ncbi:hypothetical protein Tco_0058856 [Tanacetum coccineum]